MMPRTDFGRTVTSYLRVNKLPTIWCAGCGNGIVINAMIRALERTGIPREKVVVVSGIGCSGRASGYINLCGFQPTHGRALPFATGVKLANPDLTVVVLMGDGDCLSIGGNHFLHAARRNIDLCAIVFNNSNYGMTGGQYAPTTPKERLTTTTPYGNAERQIDISELARVAGATYVARSTAYHATQLSAYIEKALLHKGFSVVEAVCHCPTQYGRMNRLGSAAEMLKWQRDSAVPLKTASSMSAEELRGKVVTGELVVPEEGATEEDYVTAYKRVMARARQRLGEELRKEEALEAASSRESAETAASGKGCWELRLSGSGGQGLMLAGQILAEAAGAVCSKHVVQTRSYGPEARGGASRSEVVISDEAIDFPEVTAPDVVLAMTQEACDKYHADMKPGGVLIVDPKFVRDLSGIQPDVRVVQMPLTEIAEKETGRAISANMVALGAIVGVTGVVPPSAMKKALLERVPKGTEAMNVRAFEAGLSWVEAQARPCQRAL